MWFRNPERWTDVLAAVGANKIVWHRGLLIKRRIDPVAHARLYFAAGIDWRVLSVGAQGVVEWNSNSANEHDPVACYPIWQYGEPFETLEDYCAKNVADIPESRLDPFAEPFYLPRRGQEHRVVIGSYPDLQSGPGRRLLALCGDLQRDYPDCILHLFSATGLSPILSTGFRSGDFDPWTPAARNRIILPNGRRLDRDKFAVGRQWVNLLGTSIADLKTARDLLAFNIRASMWAAENWENTSRFRSIKPPSMTDFADDDVPLGELPMPELSRSHAVYQGVPQPGDKVACEHCTLANSCKHYRAGSVCNLTSSDTAGLVQFFRTRDSNRIIEGLGEVLAVQARRAQSALDVEQEDTKLDPELTKVLTQMFDGGVKLAKLVNPALAAASAPKVGIQINNGHTIQAANPAALMAGLVKELEERGVDRSEITPEMVMGLIEPPKGEVVDVEVIER